MKSALDLIEIAEIQFVFVRFPVLPFDATFRSKKSWLVLEFALERQALIWLGRSLSRHQYENFSIFYQKQDLF